MGEDDGPGAGLWLAGIVGWLAYRSGRRRGEREGRPRRGRGRPGFLRDVRLPDGRDALQITANLFAPDDWASADPTWWRVPLEGVGACQDALELTLAEVAGGARTAQDVPVVLLPLGTRRRVNAVDAYMTGGRVGNLPTVAVDELGDAIRATQLAEDRPCGVLARIAPRDDGLLGVVVLLPDTFAPGAAEDDR